MNATSALPRLGKILALALIVTGSQAFGQTITQTGAFSGAGPGSIPYTFNSFDTTLGTLTGVTIEISGVTTNGSATIYNTSGYPVMFGGSGGAGYNEDLTGGFQNTFVASSSTAPSTDKVTVVVVSGTQTQLAVPPGVSPTYAGNNFTTGTLTGTQSPSPTDFSAGDLSNYLTSHGATVTITLAASTSVVASGNAGTNQVYVAGNASATASGSVNLIYTYTAVPEPSQTAAMMIGFALCVLVGRNYFKGRSLALA